MVFTFLLNTSYFTPSLKERDYVYTEIYCLVPLTSAHGLYPCSKLFIHNEVDEKVGEVVDVEGELKVAADRNSEESHVNTWHERQHEGEKETEPDLHRLRVSFRILRVRPEGSKIYNVI